MPDEFHRREATFQTREDAIKQVESKEVWGRPSRGSDIPSVKAYRGRLPGGQRGIEFITPVACDPGSSSPFEARLSSDFGGIVADERARRGIRGNPGRGGKPSAMTKKGIKSSPLQDVLAAGEFIPQAIANLPVEHFAASQSELVAGEDDLDHYTGVGLTVGGTPVAVMHYAGHPAGTSTIYLPAQMRDLLAVGDVVRKVFAEFGVPPEAVAWVRT